MSSKTDNWCGSVPTNAVTGRQMRVGRFVTRNTSLEFLRKVLNSLVNAERIIRTEVFLFAIVVFVIKKNRQQDTKLGVDDDANKKHSRMKMGKMRRRLFEVGKYFRCLKLRETIAIFRSDDFDDNDNSHTHTHTYTHTTTSTTTMIAGLFASKVFNCHSLSAISVHRSVDDPRIDSSQNSSSATKELRAEIFSSRGFSGAIPSKRHSSDPLKVLLLIIFHEIVIIATNFTLLFD